MECKLAAKLLAHMHGIDVNKITKLIDVQNELKKNFQEMISIVTSSLHETSYEKNEISSQLKITIEELEQQILTPNTRDFAEFKLQQRALHVFEGMTIST